MQNKKQPSVQLVNIESQTQESLIKFPTRFPIKIMGKNTAEFRQAVDKIVQDSIVEEDLIEVKEQLSSNERFLSFTIVAMFAEQAAIDAVYQALTAEPLVIMAL
ncbi:YbeD family protein [Rappaport israeli]|uniref:YbeD family protein n=1 Tax=Rappaport israeli TaxID=1839807 RepID=UPI000930D1C6|nr:DUF493 domain-containing protein [Rappaport israeli]